MTAMMVMITSTPARVKPDWFRGFAVSRLRGFAEVARASATAPPRNRETPQPRSQLVVRDIVLRLPLRLALHVDDAGGPALVARFLGLGRLGGGGVFGAGLVLHGLPVVALRDRIFGDGAEVVRHELFQIGGELLLVGVVIVDGLAHLVQVGAQRGLLRLLLRAADVDDGDTGEDADDGDDDEQLDESEAAL